MLVSDNTLVSGVGTWLCTVAAELQRSGHRPVVVVWGQQGPLSEVIQSRGIELTHLGASSGRDLPASLRFSRLLSRTRPDLLHFTDWPLFAVCIARAVAGGELQLSSHVNPATAKGRFVLRTLPHLADRVFTVSAKASAFKDWEFMPNPVDPPSWVRFQAAPGIPKLGVVSRLVAGKGIERIPAILRSAAGETSFRLDVYGDGPLRGMLAEELASISGLVVRFRGTVLEADEIYAGLDGLLFLAEDDTFGRPLAEAMVRGIPVVGPLRSGRIPSLLGLAAGWWSDSTSDEAIASSVARWARGTTEPADRRWMHVRASEAFSPAAVVSLITTPSGRLER